MDCFRWARKEVETALFPKAEEYQNLKVGAYDQEEDSEFDMDLYQTGESKASQEEDSSQENQDSKDSKLEEDSEEEQKLKEEQESEHERNWWDCDIEKNKLYSA